MSTTAPTSTSTSTPITLTDEAVAKITELLAAEGDDDLALRVAVRAGGCSGFSYEMYFDGETNADDVVGTFGPVTVLVDTASAPMLAGAVLRYSDGLQGEGFSIENPNAQRSCGCGKSFS